MPRMWPASCWSTAKEFLSRLRWTAQSQLRLVFFYLPLFPCPLGISPRGPLAQGCLRLNSTDGQTFGSISQALKAYWDRTQHSKCFSILVDLNQRDHKLTGYEMAYRTPAKLDCFCTQKKINELTFSQAQTSLRGGPIPALHLVFMISSLKLSETRMLISF